MKINFAGKDRAAPKLALYRLWLGSGAEKMMCLTRAGGDGTWGQFHDAYFLAEGDPAVLKGVFAQGKKKYGQFIMGEKSKKLEPITDLPLAKALIVALKKLPSANKIVNR